MAKSREINMNLPSADDLFTTQEEREQKNQEYVKNISIYEIADFPNHPFKVKMDDKMLETIESEYSCAMKSHFRKFGNQMSGSGNHLCNYASLLA